MKCDLHTDTVWHYHKAHTACLQNRNCGFQVGLCSVGPCLSVWEKSCFSFSQFWSTYLFWLSTHLKCNISLLYFFVSLSLLLPASWLIVVGTRCCSTRRVEWTWETLTARPTESRWTLRTPSQRIRLVSSSLMSHPRNKSKLCIAAWCVYSMCCAFFLYLYYSSTFSLFLLLICSSSLCLSLH